MNIVTFDDIIAHCRLDDLQPNAEQSPQEAQAYAAERDILTAYAESAEETVLNIMNRPLESLYEEYGRIPKPVWHAVLLLTAESYKSREQSSPTQLYRVSYNVDNMLKPYTRL